MMALLHAAMVELAQGAAWRRHWWLCVEGRKRGRDGGGCEIFLELGLRVGERDEKEEEIVIRVRVRIIYIGF